MLGIHLERNGVLGTTLRFRPVWDTFITNGKGLGISITIQSPIELRLLLPRKRSKPRAAALKVNVDRSPARVYNSGTVNKDRID